MRSANALKRSTRENNTSILSQNKLVSDKTDPFIPGRHADKVIQAFFKHFLAVAPPAVNIADAGSLIAGRKLLEIRPCFCIRL
jgi:hypothetical protein